jgi:hypothetical protein
VQGRPKVGEYRPVDLSAVTNAGLEVIETRRIPPIGRQSFHGLPFQIGAGEAERSFILLEPGTVSVVADVGHRADRVVVAHRRLRVAGEPDPAPGMLVAEYVFHLEGGDPAPVPIRERLEIGPAPSEGWDASGPFHAVGNRSLTLLDRYHGRWDEVGVRQTETRFGDLPDYYLWVWENPRPEAAIASVELIPGAAPVLVAAITSSDCGEHPFAREAARVVRLSAVGPDGGGLSEPGVEVDRGVASYAFGLPRTDAEAFLGDPLKGWGEDPDGESPHAYARIAAVPSATVTLKEGDRTVGRFRWGDLADEGPLEADHLRVEVVESGRNWVHVTVLDRDTDRPVPCRVHFRSPEGVPYQPHGHHDHVNSDLGTWHIDVGGDLRLGRATYAYIDGTCQGWLPRGDVYVDVARGYEYEPLRTRVRVEPGQRELTLRLKRWRNMNATGWFSGDSHTHFLSTQGSLLEQQGEDLNVVNLLQSQWGSLFTNTEDFTGGPAFAGDGRFVTWVSQENRQPFFGHIVLWGLRQPIMPWCTDGPIEAELGAWQETTMSDWADRCHEQGGTVIIPHFPLPNGEPPVLIATGRADAVEMIAQRQIFHAEYYGYLNAGYPLPLVGGTDKMSADVPVGLYRTYANLGDEEFSYEAWCGAVRSGRTFLSAGPLLGFEVEGHGVGDTLRISGPGTVSVTATAESLFPIGCLEIVRNGEVVASTDDPSSSRRLELRADLKIDEDSWIAARCGGPGYWDGPRHRDVWTRGIFAHTSPVYVTCGREEWSRIDPERARVMLELIEAGITRLRSGRRYPEGRITHHHRDPDHQGFLERPFHEARDRVRRRLDGSDG